MSDDGESSVKATQPPDAASDAAVIKGQKKALELVVNGAPLTEVLAAIVKTVEAQSASGVLGSLLLVSENGKHLVHGAAPSLPTEYNNSISGIPIGQARGSCGTAAFTGQTVVVSDTQSDPLWFELKELAATHGLRSCWSRPIFSSQRVLLGTFALYHPVVAVPTQRDCEIVELLGHTAALVIERDLHARHRATAEAALRGASAQAEMAADEARVRGEASEGHFKQLVENLPELAWTARPDGFIDFYNRRWFEYTGTTLDQMQGWGWTQVHDPDTLGAVNERWLSCIATGRPFEMEFPLRGADGVFRWFLTRAQPLRDADDKIVRWFGSNTNIDERRRHDDFKETFLAILGHDLRNPLSTILTTSRVLTMRPDTPVEIRKKLERVTSSGVRMERMIAQLLDLAGARLAGGIPVTVSSTEVDLVPVIKKIVEEVPEAHPYAKIELRVDGQCSAKIDSDRFEQVVSHLLGNAVVHGDVTRAIDVQVASRSAQ